MSYSTQIIGNLIGLSWLVFLGYWMYKAFGTKKDILEKRKPAAGIFILSFMIAVIWVMSKHMADMLVFTPNKAEQILGVVFCACGIGFAIWARKILDTNWSSGPNIKENHQLIQTGPYSITRHPIYSGLLLAIIGTIISVAANWVSAALLLLAIVNFVLRVPKEEKLMTQTFPVDYPAYKTRVRWALIPFIF